MLSERSHPGVVIHGHFLYGLPATKDKKRDVGVEQNQVKVKELTWTIRAKKIMAINI